MYDTMQEDTLSNIAAKVDYFKDAVVFLLVDKFHGKSETTLPKLLSWYDLNEK